MARDRGPRVAALGLAYPAADPVCASASMERFARRYLLTREAIAWLWDCYLPGPDDAHHPLAAPLGADLTGLPLASGLIAGCDVLRDEGQALAATMAGAGVAVALHRYPAMIHGFLRYTELTPIADEAIATLAADIRNALSA
jgi:acetyl esterase